MSTVAQKSFCAAVD